MGREFNELKAKLRAALRENDAYDKSKEFLIDLAAGMGVTYLRTVREVENLRSMVIRDAEDVDFIATPDEAVKLLPKVAKDYHNALIALGLAAPTEAEPAAKVGRPAAPQPMSDNDELSLLMRKTTGNNIE